MDGDKSFIRYTQSVLYAIFVVILAGSIVRTTHSGMGCPDWPHCFGRWIPPLNAGQLPPDYEKYLSRQDIDHAFNAFHTWIEYINRLCSVVLGIMIVVLIVWAYRKYYKSQKAIFYLSLSIMLLVAFEAWVGKVVVATNLDVVKITAHMFPAILIAVVCVWIVFLLEKKERIQDSRFNLFLWVALIALLVQMVIGTQVRADVDVVSKSFNYMQRESWLKNVGNYLQVHESFAWIAALCCIAVVGKSFSYSALQKRGLVILVLVMSEIFLGLIMTQLKMPAFAQPLHLLFSSALIVSVFSQLLRVKRK
ncbi:MAG TPA: COX15/CtaA family protein [Arachidicoccus sp.]